MITIDWSKAPDSAEAYHPAALEQYECWYKRDNHGDVYCMLAEGAHVGIWTHMGGRKDFPHGAICK